MDTQDAWNTVNSLADLLPSWARPWVLLAGLLVLGSSHISLLLHSALTMMGPGDGWLRVVLARAAAVFDFLGVNAKTVLAVVSRLLGMLKKRPAALVLALGVVMSSSSACAGYTPEAASVVAVDQGLKTLATFIQDEQDGDAAHEVARTKPGAEQREALEDVLHKWAPMRAAYAALSQAFDAYRAERSGDHRRALLAAWDAARAAAVPLHLDLPVDAALAAALAGGLP